jgi:hypothetical protein
MTTPSLTVQDFWASRRACIEATHSPTILRHLDEALATLGTDEWKKTELSSLITPEMFGPRQSGDLQWAAGFFSGEGTSCANLRYPRVKGKQYKYGEVRLTCAQKNGKTLEKFHAALGGLGSIHHARSTPNCPWRWSAAGKSGQLAAMLMFPYLSHEKRWQYLRARRKVRLNKAGKIEWGKKI